MKRVLLVLLLTASSARAADGSLWSVHAGALGGFPTSPTAFREGWGFGWGLEGGVTREFAGRWGLGLDGRYQQFRFDGEVPAGAEVIGGARRFGLFSLRLDAALYRSQQRSADRLAAEFGGGYVHQSMEPLSGAPPLTSGPADGFLGSAGLVYSRVLYAETRLLLGLRHTWSVLPDETVGSFELRLGAVVAFPSRAR